MKWTRIEFSSDNSKLPTVWISGIYKITRFTHRNMSPSYYAYYLPPYLNNWGNHVCAPPDRRRAPQLSACWHTLARAKKSCREHAANHDAPNAHQITCAARSQRELIELAERINNKGEMTS